MKTKHNRRPVLLALGLLSLLVGMFFWSVWRDVRQQKLDRALIAAVKHTDATAVVELLDRGANPEACETPEQKFSLLRELKNLLGGKRVGTVSGTPILIIAVRSAPSPYADEPGYVRAVAIVKALVDCGAQVDIRDEAGDDLIGIAVSPDYDQQILRLLLKRPGKGSRASLDRQNSLNGRTSLMIAAGWEGDATIKLLCEAGAKTDLQDADGGTALMYAVSKGRPENVACLLANHANVRLENSSGESAVSMAKSRRASRAMTPFMHEGGTNVWSSIVTMLEKANPK